MNIYGAGTVPSQRRTLLLKLLRTIFGLSVFAFGLHLTIDADIGVAPWDVLALGVSQHIHLSYGVTFTLINFLILAADLLMKEPIGLGTICDTLLVGNLTDLFRLLGLVPKGIGLVAGAGVFLLGLFLMALGQYFYMTAGLGCGPKDSFLLAVGKRLKKLPIGLVNILVFALALILGWICGGPVGLGTVLSVAFLGPMLQMICHLNHVEPRDIKHQSLITAVHQLAGR